MTSVRGRGSFIWSQMEWTQAETRDHYNIQGSDLVIDFRQVPQPSKQHHSWNLSSLSFWGTSQILTITSDLCSPTTHGPLTNVKRHSSHIGVQSLESRNTLQASKVSTEIQDNRLATSPIKLKKSKLQISGILLAQNNHSHPKAEELGKTREE